MSAADPMAPLENAESPLDVRAILREGAARLRAPDVASHLLAAELLLMHALGRDRTWMYTHPEEQVNADACARYFRLIARRAAGEPVQYLTGVQEFWGLEFEVTPAVLIPRPETEHLVEVALDRLRSATPPSRSLPLRVADVGTGSGCLAVSLARELPRAEIMASDISAAALEMARSNAERHGVSARIHFVQGDLLAFAAPLAREPAGPFDFIVSNPPYVGLDQAAKLPREVRNHEPRSALFGGPSGIEMYGRLIRESAALLRAGGTLAVELGYGLADEVHAILRDERCWTKVSIANDLAGIPRVIAAERR